MFKSLPRGIRENGYQVGRHVARMLFKGEGEFTDNLPGAPSASDIFLRTYKKLKGGLNLTEGALSPLVVLVGLLATGLQVAEYNFLFRLKGKIV